MSEAPCDQATSTSNPLTALKRVALNLSPCTGGDGEVPGEASGGQGTGPGVVL